MLKGVVTRVGTGVVVVVAVITGVVAIVETGLSSIVG